MEVFCDFDNLSPHAKAAPQNREPLLLFGCQQVSIITHFEWLEEKTSELEQAKQ